jgi:hypothetical protein
VPPTVDGWLPSAVTVPRGTHLSEHDEATQRVRVRVKKRKKRRPERRYAWIWAPLLGGLVVLVALAGLLLARDLLAVRTSLNAAQASLAEVRSAAGAIDVDRAAASLARADEELADARSRTGGPLWSLGARAPVVGDSVAVTRAVVRVASAALDVAQQAVIEGDQLLGGGLDVRVSDGQVDLRPLEDAGRLLDRLPLDRLVAGREELQSLEPRWAPTELLHGRQETLRLADEAILSIERGRELLASLPTFLGADGERRYFLGVQTPAELRGTGGLLGFWAVLTVDDGRIELTRSDVYDAADELDGRAGEGGPRTGDIQVLAGDRQRGAPASEEFIARYGHTAAPGFFASVNLDPDLPTVAPVLLDLFELRTGESLDGALLLDPIALQRILEAVGGGDLPLPEPAVAAGAPETVAIADFARFATVDLYEVLGADRTAERKLALRLLGDLAFARVFDGAWDGVAMSRAVADAAGGRHLQVFSRDEEVQASFERIGAAGHLPVPGGQDLLALVANNAVGGKQDVHVGHEVTGEYLLAEPLVDDAGTVTLDRDASLRVVLDNPLPSEGMDRYIIGNCTIGAEGGCFAGPPGQNRTWFSLWTLGTAVQRPVEDADAPVVSSSQFRGLQVFDRHLETPPESRGGFDVAYRGPVSVEWTGDGLVYELAWWNQAKANPTLLDLSFVAPEGWLVDEVDVVGGGDGRGLGVHGGGQPLEATVDGDRRARLRGTVSADTTVRLRFVASDDT